MYRKEVNDRSPLRILEKSIHGGLGAGNLGVVMARAGVGKTAALVHIALDDLMRDRPVLHIALDQSLEHVMCWYDGLFDEIARASDLEDRDAVRASVTRLRWIAASSGRDIPLDRLDHVIEIATHHAGASPKVIVVDGFDWDARPAGKVQELIAALKDRAGQLGAELWMSAQTHRSLTGQHPTRLTPPCDQFDAAIDVALFLEPVGNDVLIRLLKDHDDAKAPATHLHLHPDTLRLVSEGEDRAGPVPCRAFTLLSGGAVGAEAEFGACAEAWGVSELSFSFAGRTPARVKGLVEPSDDELSRGAVSLRYLRARMNRSFPDTPEFRKIVQTIWHQVTTAGEVFVVGKVQSDNTVRGGTGWAVELARQWRKPVYLFDQEREAWLCWDGKAWAEAASPVIRATRFAGTGTKSLTEAGRSAIRDLYDRSFRDRDRCC